MKVSFTSLFGGDFMAFPSTFQSVYGFADVHFAILAVGNFVDQHC